MKIIIEHKMGGGGGLGEVLNKRDGLVTLEYWPCMACADMSEGVLFEVKIP